MVLKERNRNEISTLRKLLDEAIGRWYACFLFRYVSKLLTTETLQLEAETLCCETTTQGTVHFLRGRGGWWDLGGGGGGHRKKKNGLEGGAI